MICYSFGILLKAYVKLKAKGRKMFVYFLIPVIVRSSNNGKYII